MTEEDLDDRELQARTTINELEERGDAVSLRRLSELYHARARGMTLYATVLTAARRLTHAQQEYNTWLQGDTTDSLADRLSAAGVTVFEPSSSTSPRAADDDANTLLVLARMCREGADWIDPPKRARRRRGDDLPPPELDWIASSNPDIFVATLT